MLSVRQHFDIDKHRQKFNYDQRRGAKELPPLEPGASVRCSPKAVSKVWAPGTVTKQFKKQRSRVVESGGRLLRRNRKHLRASTDITNYSKGMDFLDDTIVAPDFPVNIPKSTQVQPKHHNKDISHIPNVLPSSCSGDSAGYKF
ncbi:hypothetical protein DPMN_093741 [Dreissena polymorpha]|uniref:Uncharacterized protein n=1 Tax=Dreissena polymorpha TaxID=45954 RepID=A0A9D4L6B1_DREPO|nr:hypothetical protein DPMN_093741 [Dreissena polymorpha]